jgi:hypothetical protein
MLQGCAKKIQLQCLLRDLALKRGDVRRSRPGIIRRTGRRCPQHLGLINRTAELDPLSRKTKRSGAAPPKSTVPLVQKTRIYPEIRCQSPHVRCALKPSKRR